MSRKIGLLDCTLRDGGYVNDWKFDANNLISIPERLIDAGVDIIEIGFLDERRPFDADRSIMPDTASVNRIFGKLEKKKTMFVAMIDYGTCGIEHIQPASQTCLDGIRVIFKKHLKEPALEYCRQLKKLGYRVFAQLVSITSYDQKDLEELASLVNDVKPYAVSIVDTYGLLYPDDLLRYYDFLDEYIDPEIKIGFHAHNNLQLAFANGLAMIKKEGKHDIFIDATLFGMGKSAGNTPIELIAGYLNKEFSKTYSVDSMLEAIEESIRPFFEESPWGYKEFFYLCASNHCHPKYVTWFQEKNNLSVSGVNDLLGKIEPKDKKLLFDSSTADQVYNDYLTHEGSDKASYDALQRELLNRKILLIGPGRNIILQKSTVDRFVEDEKPYIISVNYIPENLHIDCVLVTNNNRYHDMAVQLQKCAPKKTKILATSNVTSRNGKFSFVVNRTPLLDTTERITDSSFVMLLKLLEKIRIQEVFCAGFDGYSEKDYNYCNPGMEYPFVKKEATYLNAYTKKKIAELDEHMKIRFLTYSAYEI